MMNLNFFSDKSIINSDELSTLSLYIIRNDNLSHCNIVKLVFSQFNGSKLR
jgi:hypothetical protein